MAKISLYLVVLGVFLLLSSMGLAMRVDNIDCNSNLVCTQICTNPDYDEQGCYCGSDQKCYNSTETPRAATPPPPPPANPPANTSVVRNTTNSTNQTAATPALDQQILLQLQIRVIDLESRVSRMEADVEYMKGDTGSLRQQLTDLSGSISQQVNQLSDTLNNLNNQQGQISTGLAGLQTNIDKASSDLSTLEQDIQKRQATTTTILYTILVLIILGVAGGVIYFVMRKPGENSGSFGASESGSSNADILDYITSHIKQGKKYPQIKEKLLKAGWSEEDISTAYKSTMKHNYKTYLSKNSSAMNSSAMSKGPISLTSSKYKTSYSEEGDSMTKQKKMTIGVVSLLLILGIFFVIRGVSTGKAIAFTSELELDAAVKGLLKTYTDNSDFYQVVESANICVEVRDSDQVVSYRVIKTPRAFAVLKAPIVCSGDPNYDMALRFNNWDSFNIVMRRMTCDAFKSQHGENGFWVLPSKYVLPGFMVNTAEDPTKFCPVLTKCMTVEELADVGVTC